MPFVGATVAAVVPLVASVLVLILVLAACVCYKDKANRIQISALRLSFPSSASRDSQISCSNFQRHSGIFTPNQADGTDNARPKVPTLQRKLPEIPFKGHQQSESTIVDIQSLDTNSELYATVDSTNKSNTRENEPDAKEVQPVAASPRRTPLPLLAETVPKLLQNDVSEGAALSSGDSDGDNPYAQVHHRYDKVKKENPYALVKGQTSEERDTDTDNYDELPMKSNKNTSFEPLPPVPNKSYNSDGDVNAQPSTSTSQLTAANAVTGRVSASEIPYLTSPLESPLRQPNVDQRPRSEPLVPISDLVYNTSQESGNDQDIRYTSISVREPLANLRTNLEATASRIQESYYMVVSDDEIYQTYDEIRDEIRQPTSDDSNNSVYVDSRMSRELPPVPPPVESLRSLASVQSKQNSSSSDVDTRHLSPCSSTVATTSPLSDTSDLYSVVNKPKSVNRSTIHVTDQQSIEDLYAKVLKNKHLSLRSDVSVGSSEMNFPSTSQSENKLKLPSHPPTVPLPELPVPNAKSSNRIRPKSMVAYTHYPDEDFMENKLITSTSSVRDLNYQESDFKDTADPGYESIGELMKSSDASSDVEGYERIRKNMMVVDSSIDGFDPNYETVVEAKNRNGNMSASNCSATEPDYETVNPHVTCDEGGDPGYEEIGQRRKFDENYVEPGYESIRGDGEGEQDFNNQDPFDPGYETICNKNRNSNNNEEKVYERVRSPYDDGDDEFSDPSYEQVNFNLDSDCAFQRTSENWDLSPRLSEVFSDDTSESAPSTQDDVKSPLEEEINGTIRIDVSEEKIGNALNVEPQYAVVNKKNKSKNKNKNEQVLISEDFVNCSECDQLESTGEIDITK